MEGDIRRETDGGEKSRRVLKRLYRGLLQGLYVVITQFHLPKETEL